MKNVTKAMADLGIHYPVAIDNDYKIWRAFNNQYWPAHYFADAKGQIRYHHFGEGAYDESERVIQELLREAGNNQITTDLIDANGDGVQQAADMGEVKSPETYLGFERAENFVSPGGADSGRIARLHRHAIRSQRLGFERQLDDNDRARLAERASRQHHL